MRNSCLVVHRAVVSHVQLCQRHGLRRVAAAANVPSAHQQHQHRLHALNDLLRYAMQCCLRALLDQQTSVAGHDEQGPDPHKRTGPQPSLP